MTGPLRVAALMDTVQVSGPGRQLVALAERLPAVGVDLRVLLFQRRGRPAAPYARFVADAGIPFRVVEDAGPFDPRLLGRVRAVLADWRPDIVQTHSYRPTALAWALRRGASWRWIGFFHGTTNEDRKVRLYHWLDRRLLPAADRIVVMSRVQAALFADVAANVQQIHNAVIGAPSSPGAEPPPGVDALPRPRIGVVGRLSREKGVDVFLDAARIAADRGAVFSAIIAGDGVDRARLEAQAAALGLADRVRFVGTVAPVEPLYAALDLVVLPSRSEGLPNVLLEALRADLPVVATAVGAVPEVLEGTRGGLMVPPERPDALASAIVEALARDPADTRHARREVVERFSLEHRVEAHLRLYHELAPRPVRRVEPV